MSTLMFGDCHPVSHSSAGFSAVSVGPDLSQRMTEATACKHASLDLVSWKTKIDEYPGTNNPTKHITVPKTSYSIELLSCTSMRHTCTGAGRNLTELR